MRYTVTEYWEADDRYEEITWADSLERGEERMKQISHDKRVQTLLTNDEGEIVRYCSPAGIVSTPGDE